MSIEYKTFSVKLFEEEEAKGRFEGYASTFGNIDRSGDRIEKGAFLKSVNDLKGKIKVLENHDFDKRVGLAEISEDEEGLKVFNGRLNLEKQSVKDLYSDMKFGLVDEFSIGFMIRDYAYEKEDEKNIRVIKQIELMEVSLVTIPANPKARLTSIKNIDSIETIRDAETCLRDAGFSTKKAKHLISVIKSARDGVPAIDHELQTLKEFEKELDKCLQK